MRLPICYLLLSLACASLAQIACCDTNKPEDGNSPIYINSNQAEFDDKTGKAHYQGNVVATQGARKLHSDTLIIHRGSNNKISLIHATGNPATFEFQTEIDKPTSHGQAQTIDYYPDEDKVILIGNASIEQAGDTITGPRLIYFFAEKKLRANHPAKGRTTVILSNQEKTHDNRS